MDNVILLILVLLILILILYYTEISGPVPFLTEHLIVPNALNSIYSIDTDLRNVVMGFHYTEDCPRCDLFRPLWTKLKEELVNITFIENDEGKKQSYGIKNIPTIIKYKDGKGYIYDGPADYSALKTWILKIT